MELFNINSFTQVSRVGMTFKSLHEGETFFQYLDDLEDYASFPSLSDDYKNFLLERVSSGLVFLFKEGKLVTLEEAQRHSIQVYTYDSFDFPRRITPQKFAKRNGCYVAKDLNGKYFEYDLEPNLSSKDWEAQEEEPLCWDITHKIIKNSKDWRKSLCTPEKVCKKEPEMKEFYINDFDKDVRVGMVCDTFAEAREFMQYVYDTEECSDYPPFSEKSREVFIAQGDQGVVALFKEGRVISDTQASVHNVKVHNYKEFKFPVRITAQEYANKTKHFVARDMSGIVYEYEICPTVGKTSWIEAGMEPLSYVITNQIIHTLETWKLSLRSPQEEVISDYRGYPISRGTKVQVGNILGEWEPEDFIFVHKFEGKCECPYACTSEKLTDKGEYQVSIWKFVRTIPMRLPYEELDSDWIGEILIKGKTSGDSFELLGCGVDDDTLIFIRDVKSLECQTKSLKELEKSYVWENGDYFGDEFELEIPEKEGKVTPTKEDSNFPKLVKSDMEKQVSSGFLKSE